MSIDIGNATNTAGVTPHALSLAEPSIRDFAINDPDCLYCDDVARILAWMEHANYLLSIARKDPDLRHNLDDISSLILRKSVLACCLEDFESAKSYALEALEVQPSALGYFRLGCAQYCLSEFKGAMDSLLHAEKLEPANAHIQRAMEVCMARTLSVKDRVPVVASAL
jgi:tetratricopeptide (TPR) repeat protein